MMVDNYKMLDNSDLYTIKGQPKLNCVTQNHNLWRVATEPSKKPTLTGRTRLDTSVSPAATGESARNVLAPRCARWIAPIVLASVAAHHIGPCAELRGDSVRDSEGPRLAHESFAIIRIVSHDHTAP